VQVLVYAFVISAAVFFGLTRTDVGRAGLRDQIESRFAERFDGSLHIAELRGDLINTLHASDVQLLAPDGRLVAHIDSVVARPQWWNLLGGTVNVRSLSILRPTVRLHRDTTGTWNVQHALRRSGAQSGSGWLDWVLLDITLRDGRLTTQNDGPALRAVQQRWLFNYGETRARNLNLQASVEWTSATRQIGVQNASFVLPGPGVRLTQASGQLLKDDGQWTLPGVTVQTERSQLQLSGELLPDTADGTPEIDVRLSESRLDFDELRALSPRLPLADAALLSGHVYGETSELVVEELAAERGRSRLVLTGTAFGLPDSLDFETNLQDSRLTATDVRAVWPAAPPELAQALGTLTADGVARGVIQWRDVPTTTFSVEGSLTAASDAGAVDAAIKADRSVERPLEYDVLLQADSLDLGALVRRSGLRSRLQGQVRLTGRGLSLATAQTEASVRLGPSRIAEQSIDSLRAALTVADRSLTGMAVLRQRGGGRLEASGRFDAASAPARYALALNGTAFDLGPLPGPLPATRLNARMRLDGRGRTWDALAGSLRITADDSQVLHPDSARTLPAFAATIDVAPRGAARPRLSVDGDALQLRMDGDVAAEPLLALGRLWGTALQDAVARALNKPVPDSLRLRAGSRATSAPGSPSSTDLAPLRGAARTALSEAGYRDTLRVRTSLRVRRSDVIRAWWPAFPVLSDSLAADVNLTVGPDTMSAQSALATDAADLGGATVERTRLVARLAGSLDAPLVQTLSSEIDLYADTLRAPSATLAEVGMNARFANRRGQVRLDGTGTGTLGELLLEAGLSVQPTRNTITLDTVRAAVGDQSWTNAGTGRIDLYRDALVVSSFQVESPRLFSPSMQRLRLRGTVSAAPSDTLYVESHDVSLYPLSQILGLRPIGGLLNGDVALTGRGDAFRALGTLSVSRFSFDRRLLGALDLQMAYVPTAPALDIQAELSPESLPFDSLQATRPSLVPDGARRAERNQLRLGGRIHLPGSAQAARGDALDLRLDVDRADLFFFEYIFEQEIARVRGFTAGTARIGGSFTDPVFDADMRVEDGRFALPRFGLQYQIEGGVRVDREGFKLSDVTVADDDGSATLEGAILFNDYRFFSFDLRGQLDAIKIIDVSRSQDLPFYGDIRVSGPATLTGPISNAQLQSDDIRATPESELFIPVSETELEDDTGFILFADSTGRLPNLDDLTRRDNILADRPEGEPTFVEGLEFDINIFAPEGSTVHLVFDPLVGDVVTAEGSGRIQLQRQEGEFFVYGTYTVSGGNYQFTAGEVFVRRFNIEDGTITWEGDPINAALDLNASYRTRASPAGLPGFEDRGGRIPLIVRLDITGDVEAPEVGLSLSRARDERTELVGSQTLDAILNQPELATEYATSVLLTNTFLLTTSTLTQRNASGDESRIAEAGNQLAFNSVSQLVASQLNRYLNEALPNLNVNLGIQGEDPQDLDVIYGVALRLLDERLIIRGEGVYTGDDPEEREARGPEGEFTVEVRLSSQVSVEAFVRRRSDDLTQGQTLTRSAGAGLSYRTEFTTWKRLFYRLFGWLLPDPSAPPPDEPEDVPAASDMVIRPAEEAEAQGPSQRSGSDPPAQ